MAGGRRVVCPCIQCEATVNSVGIQCDWCHWWTYFMCNTTVTKHRIADWTRIEWNGEQFDYHCPRCSPKCNASQLPFSGIKNIMEWQMHHSTKKYFISNMSGDDIAEMWESAEYLFMKERPSADLNWLSKGKLSIMQLNCQSLPDKLRNSDLEAIILENKFSVVLCSESWTVPDIHQDEKLQIEGDTVVRRDRNPKQCGTACYFQDGLSVVNVLITDSIGDLPCKVFKTARRGNHSVLIVHVYRPHQQRNWLTQYSKFVRIPDWLIGDNRSWCRNIEVIWHRNKSIKK